MQMDAANALGTLADSSAIPALPKMGNHKWHWIGVRINSIVSLGKIGGEEARAALLALAEYNDFHAQVKMWRQSKKPKNSHLACLARSMSPNYYILSIGSC
ncbi:MAG: HEAT repeat domain-containing protein [Anaerolineales bacterium]|nr:MAG: HEAT repeat domain-containing protein [Anaerolineales bacterium]